jgi:hypothetical protein
MIRVPLGSSFMSRQIDHPFVVGLKQKFSQLTRCLPMSIIAFSQ